VVAKMLGEDGDGAQLDAAMCCATPVDCIAVSNNLQNTWTGRIMDRALAHFCGEMLSETRHALAANPAIDVEGGLAATTLSGFDGAAVAPMMECANASDYYRQASSAPWLKRIRRPVLFVHAVNDPIVPADTVRLDDFNAGSHDLVSCITDEGGHSMEWPSGMRMESWAAKLACEFVACMAALPPQQPRPGL
jgi:predicted alpha/beta-fold hydrolase